MLTLRIALDDTNRAWRWRDGAISAGSSFVRPYLHPNLDHLVAINGQHAIVVVREAMTDTAPADVRDLVALREQTLSWPLDHILVEITPERVQVHAGRLGAAPVYLTIGDDGALHGGWELRDVIGVTAERGVDELEVMRLLTYWYRYTHQTVVRGVHQVTERSTATFDHTGLFIAYPAAEPHSLPRTLRADADPVAALETLLAAVTDVRRWDPDRAAVELSGGMDSTTVAATLASADPGRVQACGMLIPGPAGDQQRLRRKLMIKHLGLRTDHTIDAVAMPPLHPSGTRARGAMVDPGESTYTEAQTLMMAALAGDGVQTVFTGLGGDEMLSLRPGEANRPLDWYRRHPLWLTEHGIGLLEAGESAIAPASTIHEASLMSFASVAPIYLRHGLWPVSALADPALVRFGEWLPLQYRRRKRLFRDRLTRVGLPTVVVDPPLRENLSAVMSAGLLGGGLNLLDKIAADSRLVDLGLVDGDRLRATIAATRAAADPQESDHQLFRVAAVELFLRCLAG